jgi:hypothetical protein
MCEQLNCKAVAIYYSTFCVDDVMKERSSLAEQAVPVSSQHKLIFDPMTFRRQDNRLL